MGLELLDYPKANIRIVVHSQWEKMWRVRPHFKEPETVGWIDEYVGEGDVFYDVGANTGGYGLIAASRGAKVYAFEPEAMNFSRLAQNINLNNEDCTQPDTKFDITPLPVALWDTRRIETMYMMQAEPGAASHKIGKEGDEGNWAVSQAILSVQMDDLAMWDIPLPSHVKIDVDGYEGRVLAGATLALASPALRSVMIELNHLSEDYEQCMSALRLAMLTEKDSWPRSKQSGIEVFNHLFVKEDA